MTLDSNEFIEEHIGLLKSIVNRFYSPTSKFSKEDLLQEAKLATLKALSKFDSTRHKSKLTTYIYSAVHRTCRDFVRNNKFDLRYTPHQQVKDWKLAQTVKIEPPVDEQSAQPVPVSKFASSPGPMAVKADSMISFAALGGGEVESFITAIPSGESSVLDSLIKKEQVAVLHKRIGELSERERSVVNARFLDGRTLDAIAREQGVTRQRIEQISKRAIAKLSEKVKDDLGSGILI